MLADNPRKTARLQPRKVSFFTPHNDKNPLLCWLFLALFLAVISSLMTPRAGPSAHRRTVSAASA
jgi:hypothetical protein